MKKLFLMGFLLVFALIQQAIAQDRTITGTVTSATDNSALPGVSVLVKGTTTGTITNIDGQYTLSVPANAETLVFSFIGMRAQEVAIGNQSVINSSLTEDVKQLSEVVVTGFGTQTRKEFTGAAASVSGDAIKDRPVQSFAQALTGQAAGVNIIQPNGVLNNAPIIRIRGINSISLSSFPLVVIDGIPVQNNTDLSTNSAPNNPLADINPSDIESIDVLKDAASTSIYGSRGAAGVLIITTKKGRKGAAKVNYDGWVGVSQATRLPELLNAQQYMDYKNEAIANLLQVNPNSTIQRNSENKGFLPEFRDGKFVETRWYDEVYRRGVSQNHALSVSGGTDATNYLFSIGLTEQESFIKANTFQRRNARLNMNHKVTDWFSLRGNITYANTFNKAPQTGSLPGTSFASSGLARLAVALPPNVATRNADGSLNLSSANTIGGGNNLVPITFQNPLPIIDYNKSTSENNRIISNIGADLNLFRGLTFRTTYSLDKTNTENINFWSPVHGDGFSFGGLAANNYGRRNNWNWVNTLQYQTTFASDHNISLLVGTDVQRQTTDIWGAQRQTLTDAGFDDFQAGYTTNVAGTNFMSVKSIESYVSSFSYNFARRYYISANFRRDGLSALARNARWGNFGGASVGWLVSEEGFFKNLGFTENISNLKLKASWGVVGNSNLPSEYGAFSLYTNATIYGAQPTLQYFQAGNQNLSWETSKQTNIGFEYGMFNNRLNFEANYYFNDVDGLILNAPQAPSKGIPNNSILTNVGSMFNKGIELTLSGTPIEKSNFRWTTNFNFTTNKNEVSALTADNTPIPGITQLETANITRVGSPVGGLWVVKTNGVNPQNGRRIFVNKEGKEVQHLFQGGVNQWTYLDGTIAPAVNGSDASVFRNTLPTWYGGFTNNFTLSNFDLSILTTYSGGNYIYNGSQAGLRDQRFWNNHTDVLKRWQKEGDVTNIPRPIFGDNISNGSAFPISENVEKGDFVRVQNIVLGYRIPTRLFGKSGVNSLRVYGQIDNPLLITNYSGVDPEISTNGNSNIAPGVDRNTVPQAKVFTLGLNLGF